jgi:hypothetical protein
MGKRALDERGAIPFEALRVERRRKVRRFRCVGMGRGRLVVSVVSLRRIERG